MRANKKKLLQIILVTSLLFSAAIEANKPSNTPNTSAKNSNIYTADKQDIMVSANQPEFTIKLKSNPTTGYSWFLREYDASIVSPVKHSYVAGEKKLIGSPGYELWVFRIKPAGFTVPQQTNIRFVYARPWQSTDSATQIVFRITTHGK